MTLNEHQTETPSAVIQESPRSAERAVRQAVIRSFDHQTYKSFFLHRPLRAVWTFAHIWLGIVAALAAGAWIWTSHAWWPVMLSPFLMFYLGTRHNAIGVQIHEASHNLLFRNRRANELFCNFFGAYWVCNDVDSYRKVHQLHHTDLREESDPDLDLYNLPQRDGRVFVLGKLCEDLCWITAISRMLAYRKNGRQRTGRHHHALKLAAQGLLLAASVGLFGPMAGSLFYGVFWLIPLFSIFPAIVRLRIVAEHFAPESIAPNGKPFISRSTTGGFLESYLFGCDMEYHFEHHLLPGIPHPQLKKLHTLLLEKNFFEELPLAEDCVNRGYLHFWGRLIAGRQDMQPHA